MAQTSPARNEIDDDGNESDDPGPDVDPGPHPESDYETDPQEVVEPVIDVMHEAFGEVQWKLHNKHQMCYIFDFMIPAMQWKRNTVYSEEEPWVEYGPPPWDDLTETERDPSQQVYYPIDHKRQHTFGFNFHLEDFLHWEEGELRRLEVKFPMKVQNSNEHKTITKALDIPILYVQLVAQLVAEDLHGDDHDSHEALRRQSYTRQVLDQFGKEFRREFKAWKADPQAIHSKVFNPILQWYLRGVPDRYTPAITAAISGEDEPTIHDVSSFYLAKDPVDPNYASTYSQNLLYIPESRWYLAVLMGKAELKSVANFDKVRVNHDNIMEYLAEDNSSTTVSGLDSYLNEVEIRAIFDEGLEDAFEGHLGKHEVKDLVEEVRAQMAEEAMEMDE